MGTKGNGRQEHPDRRQPPRAAAPRGGAGRGEREGAAADTVLRDGSGEPAVSGHNSSAASAETRRGLV